MTENNFYDFCSGFFHDMKRPISNACMLADSMQKGPEEIEPEMLVALARLIKEKRKAVSDFKADGDREKIDFLSSFIDCINISLDNIEKFIEDLESDSSPDREYFSEKYSLFKDLSDRIKIMSSELLGQIEKN